MPPRFGWRIAAALFPLITGVIGSINGLNDWDQATTLGQHVAGAGVVVYGPLGVAAAVALLLGHRWGRPLLIAWSVVITIVGAVAPVAWGGAAVMIGIISGFSTALIAAGAIWAARMAFSSTPASTATAA